MKKIMFLLIGISLFGCAVAPKYNFYDKVPNKTLALGTKGLVIEATDGSFKWEYGKEYEVPTDYPFFNWYTSSASLALSTNGFDKVNETNAKKVIVNTPYRDEPMYGYLQISKIITECKDKSPETRSYYIQVPENYVNAAEGGKVSVMYESYRCISGYYSNGNKGTTKHGYSSWVLWLSDRPL
ncbi:MAG: hypothetical protein CO119_01420 [Flavobacteriales bacterium CG_4_9_14_3_um_filter_40_17]|nr:MAG: hypothetical protein CO119_01420 [Flavobacteriales bacterium CG_4_9_14_3_um_filter_40_17]